MPALASNQPSLCLFCSFALRTRPRFLPRNFLQHVQVANRSSDSKSKSRPERPLGSKIRYFDGNKFHSRDATKRSAKADKKPVTVYEKIRTKLDQIRTHLETPEYLDSLQLTRQEFETQWQTFTKTANLWIKRGSPEIELLLNNSGRARRKVDDRLRYLFHAQVIGQRFTQAELENQKELADLRYPTEWYPATREIARTIHLHVGPTNSGKTYHALKRLEEAESGIYLGPLRLLAHEVYSRLNAKGKPCALVTGEEQRFPEGTDPSMRSCTVEMAPLNRPFEVAVIDEIQMINHPERGWAWTQAFLGLQAREVHLCGEARTVPIIRELCALTGDKVEVHTYDRLTPLRVADQSLGGDLNKLQKGDCIVVFSVLGIHALRRQIEKKTGRKCAIVYGSLPPETRAQQARLFNDPDNDYDFLVASDAIGMGLNLSVKRIIFESTVKNNGEKLLPLAISDIKQIGGRAGRYRTAHQDMAQAAAQASEAGEDAAIGLDVAPPKVETTSVGYVTTLEPYDFPYLKSSMQKEPPIIRTAGLFPPALIVERFSNYFPPGTPFSYILLRLHEISTIHPRFHICDLRDQLTIADAIHSVRNLTTQERLTFCAAPSNLREQIEKDFLQGLAKALADNESGNLLDLEHLNLEILDEPMSGERKYLFELEQLHKMLVLYLWLSYRFPQVYTTRALANHVKKMVEDKIEQVLANFNYTQSALEMIRKRREEAIKGFEHGDEAGGPDMRVSGSQPAGMVDARDIIKPVRYNYETDGFQSKSRHNDIDEYPSPELEVLSSDGARVDELLQPNHETVSAPANNIEDLAPTVDLRVGRPHSSQARV